MPEGDSILLVEDDHAFRTVLAAELQRRGFKTVACAGVVEARKSLAESDFTAAVVDLRLADGDGLEVLGYIKEQQPATEVIILTGHGTIDSAVQAMKLGAFDYLRKPCSGEELEVTLKRARERRLLVEENRRLRDGLAPPAGSEELVGRSQDFQRVLAMADRVAPLDTTVLIEGETGVGKDTLAQRIHERSQRAGKPLLVVQCAVLQENLLESELFGHEKGAFTGASGAKHGLFEVANGGTLFLDEIGEVSPATQVKLLRVLETGRYRRVGGTSEISVDTRIIAATNRDLEEMVARGFFRKDLYYRLNTLRIIIPPLRERPEDITLLAEHFLKAVCKRFQVKKKLAEATRKILLSYHWPGNARQLLHALERAVVMSSGENIEPGDLPPEIAGAVADPGAGGHMTLATLERLHIEKALAACRGNRAQAARLLGISERTLYRKLKHYGLGS